MDIRRLGPVGAKYIAALVNPFDAPAGVQLPSDVLALPSMKVKKTARYLCMASSGNGGNVAVCWRIVPAKDVFTLSVINSNDSTLPLSLIHI